MNAVSRDHVYRGGRLNEKAGIFVLDKKEAFVSPPVNHGCIKRDRKLQIGLRIGEVVDGRYRGPRNRLRCEERAGKYRDEEQ
jgi:hypothetical protein